MQPLSNWWPAAEIQRQIDDRVGEGDFEDGVAVARLEVELELVEVGRQQHAGRRVDDARLLGRVGRRRAVEQVAGVGRGRGRIARALAADPFGDRLAAGEDHGQVGGPLDRTGDGADHALTAEQRAGEIRADQRAQPVVVERPGDLGGDVAAAAVVERPGRRKCLRGRGYAVGRQHRIGRRDLDRHQAADGAAVTVAHAVVRAAAGGTSEQQNRRQQDQGGTQDGGHGPMVAPSRPPERVFVGSGDAVRDQRGLAGGRPSGAGLNVSRRAEAQSTGTSWGGGGRWRAGD